MAQPGGTNLTLSLFDRLTDEQPRSTVEASKNEWEKLAALKKSLADDLTHLLNVRINQDDIPPEFDQLRNSVAAYGVQDYCRSPILEDEIRRSIERSIRIFEPRLTRIRVQLVESGTLELHFRVSAQLKSDLGSDALIFDAALPKPTRRFQVSES